MIGLLLGMAVGAWGQQKARRVKRGIILVEDSVKGVRAFEPYKGSMQHAGGYADIVNRYKQAFPDVNVYCMVIPNAVAIYCPDTAKSWTQDERPYLRHISEGLLPEVKAVEILDTLIAHAEEPIYSRTDHHWAPLGAWYAARCFAEAAGTPFRPLSDYEPRTVKDYVGSMWTFTRDKAVKNSPEDFTYYMPKDSSFTATRILYKRATKRTGRRGRKRRVVSTRMTATEPETFSFFRRYEDGSSGAYCTFMGGDTNTTSVKTGTNNGRRLMILKDSYGNALPSCLFGSFEEIHVVDCRYFTQNMRDFVREKGITDMLFCNNLIHASMPMVAENYKKFLTQ